MTVRYDPSVQVGVDESKLALFYFNSLADTWVYVGGAVNAANNTIRAKVNSAGIFGVFPTDLTFVPNKISVVNNVFRSGEGRTLELVITTETEKRFSLTLYDSRGKVITRIYTGENETGVALISWDGRDDANRYLSTGFYLMELEIQNGEKHVIPFVIAR